ncbi:hypothetical protein FB639_000379 [Coemansia asiatica]|nr:hypothetical protein FB639_000379 [Coemansia asiatica]
MPKCTRNACGQDYDEATNDPILCQYHPGNPEFHEGLKGWTCCKPHPSQSTYEFLTTKAELSLVKKSPVSWPALDGSYMVCELPLSSLPLGIETLAPISQSLSCDSSPIFVSLHTTQDSILTPSPMVTWSMMMELMILTPLPITQCAPTTERLMEQHSPICDEAPTMESWPTVVRPASFAVSSMRASVEILVAMWLRSQ